MKTMQQKQKLIKVFLNISKFFIIELECIVRIIIYLQWSLKVECYGKKRRLRVLDYVYDIGLTHQCAAP